MAHAKKTYGEYVGRGKQRRLILWNVDKAGWDEGADCFVVILSAYPEGTEVQQRGNYEYHARYDGSLLPGTPIVRQSMRYTLPEAPRRRWLLALATVAALGVVGGGGARAALGRWPWEAGPPAALVLPTPTAIATSTSPPKPLTARPPTPADTARPPTPTLVAHWRFNDGSGTTSADASGNGHTATLLGGATLTSLAAGDNALNLNGSWAYASVPDGTGLDGMTVLTIDAWVYLRAYAPGASAQVGIVTKWGAGGAGDDSYIFAVGGDGKFFLEVSGGGGEATTSLRASSAAIPLNA